MYRLNNSGYAECDGSTVKAHHGGVISPLGPNDK